MGRSGYSEDFGGEDNTLALYRQAVQRAIDGRRGQALLRKLRDALDAMPTKRLIADAIRNDAGDVCALGALDPNAPQYQEDDEWLTPSHAEKLAGYFGIARALAAEIVYMNDEAFDWKAETPEARWSRMRQWVDEQIKREVTSAER
jgi:hypothetical protein